MSIDNVVNAVDIAIHKLPYMESLYGQVKEQVDKMQYKIQGSNKDLNTLNDEIASAKVLLNSYHMLCERKRQDEEYLKITKGAEEEVRNILTDGKVLLQFALASIIEAMRRNPDKYNNLLVSNTSSSTPAQHLLLSHIEYYKDIILDEANRLYDMLLKYLTNSIMDNIAGASPSSNSSFSSTFPRPSNQSNTYRRIKEHRSFH